MNRGKILCVCENGNMAAMFAALLQQAIGDAELPHKVEFAGMDKKEEGESVRGVIDSCLGQQELGVSSVIRHPDSFNLGEYMILCMDQGSADRIAEITTAAKKHIEVVNDGKGFVDPMNNDLPTYTQIAQTMTGIVRNLVGGINMD